MHDALAIAQSAALVGGRILRDSAGRLGRVRSKSSATDFVTEVDIASGVAVVADILAAMPRARVIVEEPEVAEELGIDQASIDEEEVWVIDPLDGTTSYVHGFPCYSVAVALVRGGQPVAGAVYNAAADELFAAAAGLGATRSGTPIRCSGAASVREALVVTGFPYDRGAPLDRQLAALGAFLRAPVHGVRRDGSAAVDCCHVASGRADGFWEYALKPWDMAAGVVICREAGATVTDASGAPWTVASESICVAAPALHPEMLGLLHSVE